MCLSSIAVRIFLFKVKDLLLSLEQRSSKAKEKVSAAEIEFKFTYDHVAVLS